MEESMESSLRRSVVAIFIILLVAALSACRGATGTGSQPASPQAGGGPSGPTPTGEPIKIGLITGISGAYASLAQSQQQGAALAIEEINASGGVLGRPLQITARDDKLNPGEASKQAQELIQNEKVHFLIGCISAATTLSINGVAKQAGVPYLGTCQSDQLRKERGPYTFHMAMSPSFNAAVLGRWAAENLGKRWHLVIPDYAFGQENSAVWKRVAAQTGVTIAGESIAPLGTTDFSNYIPQIRASNPDVIMISAAGNDQVNFMKQANSFGLFARAKPLIVVSDLTVDEATGFANNAGSYAGLNFYWEVQNPSVQKFVKAYQAKYGAPPDGYASYIYDAIHALADAAKKAESIDPKKWSDALGGMTFDYSAGPVTVRACDGEIAHPVYIGKGRTQDEARRSGNEKYGFREIVFTQQADVSILPPCGQ
jgi:ABC-type branched-subunit amino acid transport system substrate-binding protein